MVEQAKYVSRKPPSSIEVDLSKIVKKSPPIATIDPKRVVKLNIGEK